MSLAIAAALLADGEPRNVGPEFGKASPFGLLIIVLLLLGTVALVWSMNRQLKKVPRSFDDDDGAADPGAPDDDPSR
jgi:F0F1-type ATP synthase assembly protein I